MQKVYDIIIVGAGPAGMTAALYARRAEKSVLLIERENFGGQTVYSPKIENYPAMGQISGNELADKMVEQVIEMGADLGLETVTGILLSSLVSLTSRMRSSIVNLSSIHFLSCSRVKIRM